MKSMAQKEELFRANVRKYVGIKKTTFKVIAEKAGISAEYLSHLLRGRSSPTLGLIENLASALDISVEALLAEPQPLVVHNAHTHKIANPKKICRKSSVAY
jgi:transcriptional regulator with XRE-family HTH domain